MSLSYSLASKTTLFPTVFHLGDVIYCHAVEFNIFNNISKQLVINLNKHQSTLIAFHPTSSSSSSSSSSHSPLSKSAGWRNLGFPKEEWTIQMTNPHFHASAFTFTSLVPRLSSWAKDFFQRQSLHSALLETASTFTLSQCCEARRQSSFSSSFPSSSFSFAAKITQKEVLMTSSNGPVIQRLYLSDGAASHNEGSTCVLDVSLEPADFDQLSPEIWLRLRNISFPQDPASSSSPSSALDSSSGDTCCRFEYRKESSLIVLPATCRDLAEVAETLHGLGGDPRHALEAITASASTTIMAKNGSILPLV